MELALVQNNTLLVVFRLHITQLDTSKLLPFVIAGVLWIVVAESLYVLGLQKSPSLTLASLMTLFFPLFSTILGVIFLDETLNTRTIVASLPMIGGFLLLSV